MNELLEKFSFWVGKGESDSMCIVTQFNWNGDPDGIFITQQISLSACCNRAVFEIAGGCLLLPEQLRALADQIEENEKKAQEKITNFLTARRVVQKS